MEVVGFLMMVDLVQQIKEETEEIRLLETQPLVVVVLQWHLLRMYHNR